MSRALRCLLCALALLAGCERIALEKTRSTADAERPVAEALLGEWYNTEIGRYPTPSITFVRFHPAGGVVIGGLDGSQRYGQYSVAQDGSLRVRIAEHSRASVIVDEEDQEGEAEPRLQARPARVIIDSMPVVSDQSLELQARGRIFLFTRDAQQKVRLDAAMLAYREAHAQALLRAEAAARRQAEAAQQASLAVGDAPDADEIEDEIEDAEEEEREVEPPPRRVTVRFSGDGAGSSACTGALLQQLSRPGLRVSADSAAAMVEIELSGIAYRRGTWGRYHEMHYRARVSDARDHRVLASLDATETASGSGAFEVCGDIGEDLGDEIEELLEGED